jgi:hypothetical protein
MSFELAVERPVDTAIEPLGEFRKGQHTLIGTRMMAVPALLAAGVLLLVAAVPMLLLCRSWVCVRRRSTWFGDHEE